MSLAYVGVVMRLHSGHCYSPIYDVCCWHLIVALCNLPLDITSSTCEAKFINSVFLYFSELRRRNSLGHFCILNCIFCSLNDLLVFSYSVSGLHPTIHSGYFHSASSSPLLLRGAPDYSMDSVSGFHAKSAQATVSKRFAQGPYVAARARVEPTPH